MYDVRYQSQAGQLFVIVRASASHAVSIYRTMLSRYQAIQKFVALERQMCGDESSNKTAHDQHLNFIDALKTSELDMLEGTTLLEHLQLDTPSFSLEQRSSIVTAVSAAMKRKPTQSETTTSDRQTHMYSFNYYPQHVWTTVLDKTVSFEDKLDTIATFLISIGCVNPSEPSRASMVATICVASKLKLQAEQEYAYVHQLGDIFTTKRTVACIKPTMIKFPQSVSEFVALYTTAYEIDKPPTPSPISIALIRELQSIIPTRSTNKRLKSKTPLDIAPRGERDSPDLQAMRMMMSFMMNGGDNRRRASPRHGTHDDEDGCKINICSPPRRRAISDGPAPSSSESTPIGDAAIVPSSLPGDGVPGCMRLVAPSESKKTLPADKTSLDQMAEQVKAALSKQNSKATTASDKKESKAKKSKRAAIEAAGIDEDSDTDSDSPVKSKKVKHSPKTSGAVKGTSAAVKKKPAAAPSLIIPEVSFSPTAYNGGKIYFAKTKSKYGTFRCYVRIGDKVEKTIAVTEEGRKAVKRAWCACLSSIDTDARPRA
jgi:hypothetical protein